MTTQRDNPGGGGKKPSGSGRIVAEDMGAHPAYGHAAAEGPKRATKEEDYGGRGLHRQAGTVKTESLRSRGVDPESRDAERETKSPAARKGRKVARGQTVKERDANRRPGTQRR